MHRQISLVVRNNTFWPLFLHCHTNSGARSLTVTAVTASLCQQSRPLRHPVSKFASRSLQDCLAHTSYPSASHRYEKYVDNKLIRTYGYCRSLYASNSLPYRFPIINGQAHRESMRVGLFAAPYKSPRRMRPPGGGGRRQQRSAHHKAIKSTYGSNLN